MQQEYSISFQQHLDFKVLRILNTLIKFWMFSDKTDVYCIFFHVYWFSFLFTKNFRLDNHIQHLWQEFPLEMQS